MTHRPKFEPANKFVLNCTVFGRRTKIRVMLRDHKPDCIVPISNTSEIVEYRPSKQRMFMLPDAVPHTEQIICHAKPKAQGYSVLTRCVGKRTEKFNHVRAFAKKLCYKDSSDEIVVTRGQSAGLLFPQGRLG